MEKEILEKRKFAAPEWSNGDRREAERNEGAANLSTPNSEVLEIKKKRKYSRDYKLKILEEVDKVEERSGIGSILRREGLYSTAITRWRKQRENGELDSNYLKNAGRLKDNKVHPREEVNNLKRENKRLKKKLEKADRIIDFQKKISKLLGISLEKKKKGKSK